jgi:SpoVK/Ycf46/Vps4 family AAA+-type ATPase
MPVNESIISAMVSAVEKEPQNIPLRLHLVSLLLEDSQFAPALMHCQTVLGQEPTNLEALEKAAQAAEKSGEAEKAAAYRLLFQALSGKPAVDSRQVQTPSEEVNDKDIELEEKLKSFADDEWADVLSGEIVPERVAQVEGSDAPDLSDPDDKNSPFEIETPDLKLSDVAGMDLVKRRLNLAFLAPLKNPEMMKLYGKSLRGGLLLYGAPGCGKTFIARAVAGELGARFISIGLSDVLDMWIGSSERNIHEIFARARRKAPCVVFFDEIDALGRKRSLTRHSGHGAINQLLSELDGVNQNNDGVFVLAATNHPWDVDTALRRPGRFDRTLLVLPPDQLARETVLNLNLKGRPVDGSVDVPAIAKQTNEFSGADLAHLVETAAEFAMEDSIMSGKVRSITQNDFKRALREIRQSTRPWFDVARNYAMFANEGGVYDDLLEYLKDNRLM